MATLILKHGHDFICYVKNINFMLHVFVLLIVCDPKTGRDSITGCEVYNGFVLLYLRNNTIPFHTYLKYSVIEKSLL